MHDDGKLGFQHMFLIKRKGEQHLGQGQFKAYLRFHRGTIIKECHKVEFDINDIISSLHATKPAY